jgi:hypothetical protein
MVVTGLLTGQNTLTRHLYIMGLVDSPLCRMCGAEEETPDRFFKALATHTHTHLGSFFLDPEYVRTQSGGNMELY